ncbi:hypothetical protein BH11PLA2_BH11PLA2_21250 [soil metagenome]
MIRFLIRSAVALGGVTFGLCTLNLVAQDEKPKTPTAKLRLTRVVLTNAGIGYFYREGTIDGTARVELQVDESDVNDLILSLLAEDTAGTAQSVTYDNRAPAEITLKAFSIDLTENPSVGSLLAQVRGEKVEITYDEKSSVTGSILSVQKPVNSVAQTLEGTSMVVPARKDEVEQINLFSDDGLVSVPLAKIRKVKFVKPELQAEFRKALEALAASRGEGKKAVAVTFNGVGQRKVSLGYIAEAPLWKPTYRLKLGAADAKLQGLAAVENTTDDDWVNVKVKLVSGRPITFKMDLYDLLYVPRPTVEPEMYASLRPPLYQGPASMLGGGGGLGNPGFNFNAGQLNNNAAQGAGVLGGNGIANNLGVGGGVAGISGGQIGQFGNLGGQFGVQGGNGYYGVTRVNPRALMGNRLSYDELRSRLVTKEREKATVVADPTTAASVNLGEAFEYTIADPVTLARFKSALLPVLSETLESEKLSIFNPAIHAGYPLKGIRLKNTSKQFLAQGPVTIFDGDSAAGQARLPDVKPGETRLLSYAIDLDVKMQMEPVDDVVTPVSMKIVAGELRRTTRVKSTTRYTAANRSAEPRTLWITQAIKPRGWKLITPAKAAETTSDLYRFELKLASNTSASLEVIEEKDDIANVKIAEMTNGALDTAIEEATTPAAVKAALVKVRALEKTRTDTIAAIKVTSELVREIVEEQGRQRANLATLPPNSEAYKRTVKKFDDQETAIETHRVKIKDLEQSRATQTADLATLLKGLNAE